MFDSAENILDEVRGKDSDLYSNRTLSLPVSSDGGIMKEDLDILNADGKWFDIQPGDESKKGFLLRGEYMFCELCIQLSRLGKKKASEVPVYKKPKDGSTSSTGNHMATAHTNHDITLKWYGSYNDKHKRKTDEKISKKFGPLLVQPSITDHVVRKRTVSGTAMISADVSPYNKTDFQRVLVVWALEQTGSWRNCLTNRFQEMIYYLSPQAAMDIPSRPTLMTLFKKEAVVKKDFIRRLIKTSPYKISISIDGWTNRRMHGFLAILIRIAIPLNNSLELMSIVLDLVPSSSHTAESMHKEISSVLNVYGIDKSMISAFVMDNASSNTLLVNLFNNSKISSPETRQTQSVYCFAHCLHRVVTSMLGVLEWDLDIIRKLVRTINKSSKLRASLEHEIKRFNLDRGEEAEVKISTLPADVATRWNSTHDLLKAVGLLKKPLQQTIKKNDILHFAEHLNYDKLKEICAFLEQFKRYQETTTHEQASTIGLVLIEYNLLLNELETCLDLISDERFGMLLPSIKVTMKKQLVNDFLDTYSEEFQKALTIEELDFVKSTMNTKTDKQPKHAFAEEMNETEREISNQYADLLKQVFDNVTEDDIIKPCDLTGNEVIGAAARAGWMLLSSHYNRISEYHVASSVLDPRFNIRYLQDRLDFVKADLDSYIYPCLNKLYNETTLRRTGTSESNQGKRLKVDSSYKSTPFHIPSHLFLNDVISKDLTELEQYYTEPTAELDINPLVWWYQRRDRYPKLSKLAIESICIPATTTSVERLFSEANCLCAPVRNRMLDTTIQMVVCLKTWLRLFDGINSKRSHAKKEDTCNTQASTVVLPKETCETNIKNDTSPKDHPLQNEIMFLAKLRSEHTITKLGNFILDDYLETLSKKTHKSATTLMTESMQNNNDTPMYNSQRKLGLDIALHHDISFFPRLAANHYTAALLVKDTTGKKQHNLYLLDSKNGVTDEFQTLQEKLQGLLNGDITTTRLELQHQSDGTTCGYRLIHFWKQIMSSTKKFFTKLEAETLADKLGAFKYETIRDLLIAFLEEKINAYDDKH